METAATPEVTTLDGSAVNVRRALTVGGLGAAALAFGATRASAAESDALTLVAAVENGVAVAYGAAAGLDSVKAVMAANATIKAFLVKTISQHQEVIAALVKAGATKPAAAPSAAVAKGLGIDDPAALAKATAVDVIDLAVKIEGQIIATVASVSTSDVSADARKVMAQAATSAGARQAVLRAVKALAGSADTLKLVTIDPPVDASKLPAAAGSVGFPADSAPLTNAITGA